jgi:glutamine amidotransferase
LERVGADVTVSADPGEARRADGLVVPGVGAFAACMAGLRAVQGPDLVREWVEQQRPVLGICVGMQVLFDAGIEHGVETAGLGVLAGRVERLTAPVLPHMGWNTVDVPTGTTLFDGIEKERFYFVHSYGVRTWHLTDSRASVAPLVTWTTYGGDRFVAAVENGSLSATQFHPEKSGDAGATLLSNWVRSL